MDLVFQILEKNLNGFLSRWKGEPTRCFLCDVLGVMSMNCNRPVAADTPYFHGRLRVGDRTQKSHARLFDSFLALTQGDALGFGV